MDTNKATAPGFRIVRVARATMTYIGVVEVAKASVACIAAVEVAQAAAACSRGGGGGATMTDGKLWKLRVQPQSVLGLERWGIELCDHVGRTPRRTHASVLFPVRIVIGIYDEDTGVEEVRYLP